MGADELQMKIAVVGGGVAGITTAYLLSKRYDVTLIEGASYLGGHTNTIEVKAAGNRIVPVDTGFIVCNPVTYPLFYGFLRELGISLRDSDMSFGFSCDRTGLSYIGPALRDFLKNPRNLLNPRFIRLLGDQHRFNSRALEHLGADSVPDVTLGEYLRQIGVSDFFIDNFIIPLGSAIWSSPDRNMLDFPARVFLTFFHNHGVLRPSKQPTWQTVVGGSYSYVRAFRERFRGQVIIGDPAAQVRRLGDNSAEVRLTSGETLNFHRLVIATHADQALRLLEDPSEAEASLLGAWSYHANKTVLHTDRSIMPKNRRVWASWNYRRLSESCSTDPLSITYYMNRLQGLSGAVDYFVTLNDQNTIAPDQIIYSTNYTHPCFTAAATSSQDKLRDLNGTRNTFFCGSYMRYGFHEDAVWSAVSVARSLGVDVSWGQG
jgi:predicted NAD/FAD-binding protein